jgi:hypothetical protein
VATGAATLGATGSGRSVRFAGRSGVVVRALPFTHPLCFPRGTTTPGWSVVSKRFTFSLPSGKRHAGRTWGACHGEREDAIMVCHLVRYGQSYDGSCLSRARLAACWDREGAASLAEVTLVSASPRARGAGATRRVQELDGDSLPAVLARRWSRDAGMGDYAVTDALRAKLRPAKLSGPACQPRRGHQLLR